MEFVDRVEILSKCLMMRRDFLSFWIVDRQEEASGKQLVGLPDI